MPDERYALLVNLGKKITDYHVDHDKMDEGTRFISNMFVFYNILFVEISIVLCSLAFGRELVF